VILLLSDLILNVYKRVQKAIRVTVAIIGTAGRGNKAAKISKEYAAMIKSAVSVVDNIWKSPGLKSIWLAAVRHGQVREHGRVPVARLKERAH